MPGQAADAAFVDELPEALDREEDIHVRHDIFAVDVQVAYAHLCVLHPGR